MSDLLLMVQLGGRKVALPSAQVESVVEIESLTPVPRAASHVAGLSALRSRVVTVIDCAAVLHRTAARRDGFRDAVVAVVDGHPYALLVDSVEDVVEASGAPRPLPGRLDGDWGALATACVKAEGDLLLLLDVHTLIAGPAT